jgi:hypothetical protein
MGIELTSDNHGSESHVSMCSLAMSTQNRKFWLMMFADSYIEASFGSPLLTQILILLRYDTGNEAS